MDKGLDEGAIYSGLFSSLQTERESSLQHPHPFGEL